VARQIHSRIGYELKRAQYGLRQAMDAALRPLGLSTPQYAVLANVREIPGASGARLARTSFVSPQTMNELLVSLEGIGWIERIPSRNHGRVIGTHLTPAGHALLAQADARVADVEHRLAARLDRAAQGDLLRTLQTVADNLEVRGSGTSR
jgi:DNA-binding MarR family transcriptional regulator